MDENLDFDTEEDELYQDDFDDSIFDDDGYSYDDGDYSYDDGDSDDFYEN